MAPGRGPRRGFHPPLVPLVGMGNRRGKRTQAHAVRPYQPAGGVDLLAPGGRGDGRLVMTRRRRSAA